MKLRNTRDPNKLEFVQGGGVYSFVGLIIFCGGVALYSLLILSNLMDDKSILVIAAGTVLCLLGFFFLFGRSGITIDLGYKELEKWKGFIFLPITSNKFPLQNFTEIRITKQVHRNKNTTYYSYPVHIVAQDGNDIQIDNPQDILRARSIAENCAKNLKIPLLDTSDKTENRRNWDELDMSIRQRAEKNGENPSLEDAGEIPGSLKQFGGVKNGNLHLEIPPSSFAKLQKLLIPLVGGAGLIIPVTFVLILFSKAKNSPPVFIVVFMAIFFLFPLIFALIFMGKRLSMFGDVTAIHADDQKLTLIFGKTKREWDADEIEEFILLPRTELPDNIPEFAKAFTQRHTNGGITVRSDKLYSTFGFRFEEEEQEWIYKTLYALLAG